MMSAPVKSSNVIFKTSAMRSLRRVLLFLTMAALIVRPAFASEVLQETSTKVAVKVNPKTGKSYVSIVGADAVLPAHAVVIDGKLAQRPDYRMLDPKMKPGDVPYEGPYSNRTKVYVLAATLATVGTVSGIAAASAIPATTAATSAAGAGGAGVYAAGGAAVATGTVSTAWLASRPKPNDEDFRRGSESHVTGDIRQAELSEPHFDTQLGEYRYPPPDPRESKDQDAS
ncbi:MAG: hypothetical protein PHN49_10885 [Candidatus Omnitrophica bacterium]|nr:hypothetical protein [Candidatus Omnitrophota bacterium]MDD5672133.1 hypothetical protein [Candidatus Omnitrophota bacterium]